MSHVVQEANLSCSAGKNGQSVRRSYTLRSFMPMKCHCLFVTSNSTSNQPLIFFYVFSYNGVYASPFGVPNTSLSLRLVVPRVPSAACIAGANWRYI